MTQREYVGIDLGTTFSSVAIYKPAKKQTEVILFRGKNSVPSIVYYEKDQPCIVGSEAEGLAASKPENAIYDSKRMLGHKFSKIKNFVENWPFTAKADKKQNIEIHVADMVLKPFEVSGHILKYLKEETEKFLKHEITSVCITHPQQFNSKQIEETKLAATKIAGFEDVALICEPTAAVLTICDDLAKDQRHQILVYDFGGGTFDVSIAEVSGTNINVTKTDGNSQLGGQDIDMALVDFFRDKIEDKFDFDIKEKSKDKLRYLAIAKKSCKEIKEAFSSNSLKQEFVLDLPGNKIFKYTMQKKEFEGIISGLIDKTIVVVRNVITDASTCKVMLVGGSSFIPLIKSKLQSEFGFSESSIYNVADPLCAVARGGAIWRYQCSLKHQNGTDPGAKPPGKPAQQRKPINMYSNSDDDDIKTGNKPDQKPQKTKNQITKGSNTDSDSDIKPIRRPAGSTPRPAKSPAADNDDNLIITQRLAKSIGLKTIASDGSFTISKIIFKGAELPAENTKTYANASDDDEALPLEIYMGEDPNPSKCELIADYQIPIQKKSNTTIKARTVKFQVTFRVNEENIMSIKVTSLEGDYIKNQQIEVKNKLSLTEEETARIDSNQARLNAAREMQNNVEAIMNEIETYISNVEKKNPKKKRQIVKDSDDINILIDEINDTKPVPMYKINELKGLFEQFKKKYPL